MSGDLRSGLSIVGYCLVFILIVEDLYWSSTTASSTKRLARLLEQSSPDLKEDLLSAVELGISNQTIL